MGLNNIRIISFLIDLIYYFSEIEYDATQGGYTFYKNYISIHL